MYMYTQAYLVLLLQFVALCRHSILYRLQVCGKPVWSRPVSSIFQQHLLTLHLCCILITLPMYQLFHYCYHICYRHLWSYYYKKDYDLLEVQWWLPFFQLRNYFKLRNVDCFFRHIATALNILQYKQLLHVPGKQTICLTLFTIITVCGTKPSNISEERLLLSSALWKVAP